MLRFRQTYPFYFILFFLLVIVIGIIGHYYYNYVQDKVKREAHSELSTLANLKITEIVKWRQERLGDAKFIQSNIHFKNLVNNFLNNPNSQTLQKEITEWLRPIKENHEYSNLSIIGNSGNFFTLFNSADNLNPVDSQLIKECIDSMEIILSGFYKYPNSNVITLGVFIPLSLPNKKPFGVLQMRIDPKINLYPIISLIPTSSATTESFLVRQDGDSIIFLNELKFRKNSALSYKLPLSNDKLPSAMVVKGMQGIYEGVDYSGNGVLADLNKIPDSPWYIVSKINLDEVYEPLREQALYIIAGILVLISLCGALVFIAWRNEKLQIIQKELQAEERFSKAFSANPNALVISRTEDGVITEVNETFLRLFGYHRSEVIGKSSLSLNMFSNPKDRDRAISLLKENNRIRDFEIKIKLKSSEERIALLSSEILEFDNSRSFLTIIQDITEKVKAEKALQESEEQLKKAQEISHLGSWELDLVNNKLTWSDEVYRIFGLEPQEFAATYEAFLEAVHPEDREAVNEAYSSSIRDGKDSYEIEHRIIRKRTDEIRIVHEKCEHFRDDTGKIIRSVGMVHDVTERKKTENELAVKATEIEAVFSNTGDAIIVYDNLGKIIRYNQAADQILRYLRSDRELTLIERSTKYAQVWTEDNRRLAPEEMPAYRAAVHGETIKGMVLKIQGRGDPYWVILSAVPLLVHGKHIGGIVSMSDITRLKRAEEALRESEIKLLDAQHLAHIGSFESDIQSGKVSWSREIFNIYERDPALGELSYDEALEYVHPEDRKYVLNRIKEGSEANIPFEFEYRIIVNSKVKFLFYIGKPVFDESAKLIKRIGAVIDITERKLSQIRLEELLKDLKRSNEELEQFAYTASHDLQEPVRMIKSYAQILSMNYKEVHNNTSIEHLNYIIEGASRMQALINDLLKYSRVNTTKKKFEPVDCNALLQDVIKDLKLRIKEENAHIEVSELPVIKGDKTQLRQVFQNLILNAVKFRSENDPLIKIKSERKDGKWVFSIKDNGIGIDPRFHEKIFEIFQRLHHREKYPGTGIGLSICKKIIELHRGQIYIESELNKGTTFYFTIPA